MDPDWIVPEWAAPAMVGALSTTRAGGASEGPYAGLNLGGHVGDDPARVRENRERLARCLPGTPLWLDQVHGTDVADADAPVPVSAADAAVSRRSGRVLAIMTADCLPVLLCDDAGTVVGAAHAGWRGLCHGVLENTVAAMGAPPSRLSAWLGPAIGPGAFEVGDEVRAAFTGLDSAAAAAFRPGAAPGKWLADLYALARRRLQASGLGAANIHGGGLCTVADARRFYSYRRDRQTGRMASLIWLK